MKIAEVMSRSPVCCEQTESLNRAVHQMWEHDYGALPVVNPKGERIGILTDRDACMAAYIQGKKLDEITVGRVMSKTVYTCKADESLEDAEKLMGSRQIRRLPVVGTENRPVGMVSLNDIARHASSVTAKTAYNRGLSETLAAICQPREVPAKTSIT